MMHETRDLLPVGYLAHVVPGTQLVNDNKWLWCKGQWLTCEQYPELYATIGTQYGVSYEVKEKGGLFMNKQVPVGDIIAFRLPDLTDQGSGAIMVKVRP